MSDHSWVKPVSIASLVAISIVTLTSDKIAIVGKAYNFALEYDAHGWAILSLIFFALLNQYLAIGMPERTQRLKDAEKILGETNKKLVDLLQSWQNLSNNAIRLNGSTSNQNAFKVLHWLVRNPRALQDIADKNNKEIMKG